MEIIYRPLKERQEEIRVLDLEPAERLDAPLHATLRHAKLQDASFSALSYVWGDPDKDKSNITIKYKESATRRVASKLVGKSVPTTFIHSIGSSLARALRHLRQRHMTITIWADALCINQSKSAIKEKNSQLPLMKSVYSNATEVLAWLGPRFDDDVGLIRDVNAAFELADIIWSLAGQITDMSRLPEDDWLEACFTVAETNPSLNEAQRNWTEFAIRLRSASLSNQLIKNQIQSFQTLSRNPYFSRMWILQETGRARKLTFHFGLKRISHRRIILALSLAESLYKFQDQNQTGKLLNGFDNRYTGCLEGRTTVQKKLSLRDVLAAAYFRPAPLHQAGKKEDLIYARLGLADNPREIEVDYDLSIAEVFTEASRFLLYEGFLEILVAFRPYRSKKDFLNVTFPSWAYDWSEKASNSFDKYNASGGTTQQVSVTTYCDAKLMEVQVLTMRGFKIGSIGNINEKFSDTVLASGLHEETIRESSLLAVADELSEEKRETLSRNIHHAYLLLGIPVSDEDLNALFNYRSLPFAKFWCWWITWVSSLIKLMEDLEPYTPGKRVNVAELLFREDPGALGNNASMHRLGTRNGILTLVDYQRWLTLMSSDTGNNSPEDRRVIDFAELLFRSARGMRSVILDSGHLGYVPEDARAQDDVVIFYGVKAPLVIRKTSTNAYRIVGPAHICGAMQGELMQTASPECMQVGLRSSQWHLV